MAEASQYDLSAGENPPKGESDRANELLADARHRRHYRTAATVVGILVIGALVYALIRIISAITSVPESLREHAKNTALLAAHAASAAGSAASAATGASAAASEGGAGAAAVHFVDGLLNPTGAVVGLVASLSIAITVLTIALVRATFHSESKDAEASAVATLPSAEVLKSVGAIFEGVGKALGGGKG